MVTEGKTPKRRAAEAFLQSRFTPPLTSSVHGERPCKRRHTSTSARVSACSTSSQAIQPCCISEWCSFDVCLPHVNWSTIASSRITESHNTVSPQHLRLPRYQLPHGIDIYLVDRTGQIPEALRLLRKSMEDSVVSIDLEWKPDFVKDTSKVALMQLASATCCILIRICKLGSKLPEQLLQFLRDPNHTVLGFAWGASDEKKMQRTFRLGQQELFGNLLDLQSVVQDLGYQQIGLTKLTEMVLGCPNHKSKKISMSNWEARSLSPQQMQYAALDALLTGQVFRGLRLWHSAPSACSRCHQDLGGLLLEPELFCTDESCRQRRFNSLNALRTHEHTTKHTGSAACCQECGRTYQTHSLEQMPSAVESNSAACSDKEGGVLQLVHSTA